MKMHLLKTIFLLITSFSIQAEYPYVLPPPELNGEPRKIFEVTNLSATKSQDGLGICYGFTATALLENFRCRSLKISCYDPKQQLSTLDVTSHYKPGRRSLREGGFSKEVLKNVAKSERKIVKESCLNYAQIIAKNALDQNQKQGWNKLSEAWAKFKGDKNFKQEDCIHCLAVEIKNNMLALSTSVDQIENAFKTAKNVEEFIYQSILPKECMRNDQKFEIPPFDIHSYPPVNSNYTAKDLSKKVESVLTNNIPMELSFCAASVKGYDVCPEGQGHSISLIGIRENCNKNTGFCKKYVRVRNSYGWTWQKYNNHGWIDLDELMLAASKHNKYWGGQLTWLQEPGRRLEVKSL